MEPLSGRHMWVHGRRTAVSAMGIVVFDPYRVGGVVDCRPRVSVAMLPAPAAIISITPTGLNAIAALFFLFSVQLSMTHWPLTRGQQSLFSGCIIPYV